MHSPAILIFQAKLSSFEHLNKVHPLRTTQELALTKLHKNLETARTLIPQLMFHADCGTNLRGRVFAIKVFAVQSLSGRVFQYNIIGQSLRN